MDITALHTGAQSPNTNALHSGQNASLISLRCCAKQSRSSLVPLLLHLQRCLLSIQVCNQQATKHCSKVQGRMHCSKMLCKNRLTAFLCHCFYIYEGLPFSKACNLQTPMYCSRVQGRMHALLLWIAVQRLAGSISVPLHLRL